MMTFNAIKTATLDQLTDELAAAGWDSTQTNIRDAREAVSRLLCETNLLPRGIDLDELADTLGYDEIKWDIENDCFSGYGSSDPMDRSRDDADGFFVASDDDELKAVADESDVSRYA